MQTEKKARLSSLRADMMRNLNVFALIVLILIFYFMNSSFLGYPNVKNLLADLTPILIMACGTTFVILLGAIDLSIGAVCSCANVLTVALFPVMGYGAYAVAALFGVVSGLVLGVIHAKLKIPSFIASLAFMSVWNCVALLIANAPVAVPQKLKYLVEWAKTSYGIISLITILAVLFAAIFYFIQVYTKIGKGAFAIGGNERVARLAGINVDRIKILVFALSGLCSALGGILLAAKLKSSAPTVGTTFTLLVIAAVALGGTALTGGKGNILGTMLGVALVTVIQNGMNIVGIDVFWQQITFGIVVIVAVALTVDHTRRNLVVK